MPKIAETELAAAVINWLAGQHWEVYQEVRPGPYWPRADIVATQAWRVWVIECKTSLSLSVLAQAEAWKPWCNWRSIAVPAVGRSRGRDFAYRIAERFGIGILVEAAGSVKQAVPAELSRRRFPALLQALAPEHRTEGVAGSRDDYWTPFKQTCRELAIYVREHPGCVMKEAVDAIRHHYRTDSTARSCLHSWLGKGLVPGVARRRNRHRLELFPEAAKEKK